MLLAALERGMDRGGEIVAVGGGAVCDVAAFAASIYLRGVRLTLAPTTVTAMVDAALGGKTGINLRRGKNLVGTFYPAHRLVVMPHAVRHLSSSDYLDGLAEVIKTAMLGDGKLFGLLECRRDEVLARSPALVEEYVRRCLAVKARFVAHDLREELGTVRCARTAPRGRFSIWGIRSRMRSNRRPASRGATAPRWRGVWGARCASAACSASSTPATPSG